MTRPHLTSWVTVIGPVPQNVVTYNGTEIAAPEDAMGFLVTRNPGREPILGPTIFRHFIAEAKRNDWTVFKAGRSIVYVFNNAWNSTDLVQQLVTVLVDSQYTRIPSADGVTVAGKLRRRVRRWVRELLAPATRGTDTVVAPLVEPAPAAPATGAASERPTMALVAASAAGEPEDGEPA